MINQRLPTISLVLLLSLACGGAFGRFLQTSNSTTPIVIATRPLSASIAFNSSLQCGECVVGGYISCVNGPQNYTGSAPLKTVCCQNLTSCPQAKNTTWNCSSIYANKTTVDQLRVCPFDVSQCGQQQLNFNYANATQCLHLNSIKKGTACLYQVQSMCGVPNFKVNDTANILTGSLMLSNTSVAVSTPLTAPSCSVPQNQQCVCRTFYNVAANSTNYICDCNTVRNRTFTTSACSQCTVFTDSQGNQISQCSCAVPTPVQFSADQYCTCSRSVNLVSNKNILTCQTGCGAATPTSPIVLPDNQCSCVNSTNNGTTQLSCVCRNVNQCVDPSTIPVQGPIAQAPAPCQTSYPCQCASVNGTQNLSCQCTNPQSNLVAQIYNNASQCQCSNSFNTKNNSWSQSCSCCLADSFVRANLLAPVTCNPGDIKEQCVCNNQTISNLTNSTSLSCSCAFPSNGVSQSLQFPSQGACDCDNITLGSKSCKCCVSQAVQIQQQQPSCLANSSIQSCQCQGNSTQQTCSCISTRTGFTFTNMTTVIPSACFCQGNGNLKSCNCCVSDAQYKVAQPQCVPTMTATPCSCDTSNTSFACDCQNKYFFNTTTNNTVFGQSGCACFPSSANQTTGVNCQCCANQQVLNPAPQCSAEQAQVQGSNCRFNQTLGTVACSFNGQSVFASSAVSTQFAQNLTLNVTSCGCSQDLLSNSTKCSCCVNQPIWELAQPVCNSTTQLSEKCNCHNISTTVNKTRPAVKNVTTYLNVTCMKTGSNGELCSSVAMASSSIWNNSYACYAPTSVACVYQASTAKCGFTVTSNLTACLAAPPAVANKTIYQNQPVTQTTVTAVPIVKQVNYNQTYNVTSYNWTCGCSNTRYPSLYISKAPVSQAICGCDSTNSTNQTCNCCINKNYENNLYLNQEVCLSNQTATDCLCNYGKNVSQCACQPLGQTTVYKNLVVDATKCTCFNVTNTTQACRCCNGNVTTLMPKAPVCNSTLSTSQQCMCQSFVNSNKVNNLQCDCLNTVTNITLVSSVVTTYVNETFVTVTNATNATNGTTNGTSGNSTNTTTTVVLVAVNTTVYQNVTNVTYVKSTQFLTPSQCSCLTFSNGTAGVNQYSCNCCVQNTFQCPANSGLVLEDCSSCTNYSINATAKTQGQNCSCTRRDNGIVGQLTFPQQLCNVNNATGLYQCCANQTQLVSQWPVLSCSANSTQKQNCTCTTVAGQLSCNCIRQDNGRPNPSPFTIGANQCQIKADNTTYQCCVPQVVIDTQIPYQNCNLVGSNLTAKMCQCTNMTFNVTLPGTNTTSKQSQLICNCKNDQFLTQQTFNLSSSSCLMYNNSVSQCCLNNAQTASLIPQLSCPASGFQAQTGCSCTNAVIGGSIQSNCNCNFNYQSKVYTAQNLTTFANNCVCNTTTCGCCIPTSTILQVTQKQCTPNQFKSSCNSCVSYYSNVTNSTQYNCSQCSTQGPSYTSLNQSYSSINTDSCLCRSPGANCTCCLNQGPAVAAQPQCQASANQLLPNCACSVVNGTYNCDCSRASGNVVTQYNGIKGTNCSCTNVVRPSGLNPLQCSCCASAAQLATPAPVCSANTTANPCTCDNNFNCNCNYQNTGVVITAMPLSSSSCSCPNSNATSSQCGCCVSVQQYRDFVTPSCPPSVPLATCACSNTTVVVGKVTSVVTKCNCTGDLQSSWGTVSNTNLQLNTNTCGSYNASGSIVYKCCVPQATLTQLPAKQCSASQLTSNCSCPASFNGVSRNCSCVAKSVNVTSFLPVVSLGQSDCSCYNLTVGGKATQQCSCCVNQTLTNATLVVKAPVCNANTSTSQSCICRSVFDSASLQYLNVCNCTSKVGNVAQTRTNVVYSGMSQCSCLNQTVNGQSNQAQCSCCVPNPPPTMCQNLAQTNSSILNCRCGYVVVNGQAEFSCNCSAQATSTKVLYANQMVLDEKSCCCIEKSDISTGMGYKSCNCTQPAYTQIQNCQCTPIAGNSSQVSCVCSDCNSVQTMKVYNSATCQCPSMFASQTGTGVKAANTTNTTNTTKPSTGSGNGTNGTNGTNTTVKSNTTTGPTVVANSTNATNASHPTNTTGSPNVTNSTGNTTKPNTNINGTNSTNGTVHTNGTNATGTPNATQNLTNNGTKPNVTSNNGTANGTNTTNTTHTSGTTTNGTAGNATNGTVHTNGTAPNATVNGTNGTTNNGTKNGTAPNITTNGTAPNATNNGTAPNTTTNGTKPGVTTNNGTNGTNGTIGTNGTNGTSSGNHTNGTINGTQGNNQTVNGTGNGTHNSSSTNTSTTVNTTIPVVPSSVFSCACPVQYSGLCPPVDMSQPVSQGSCAASNVPQPLTVTAEVSSTACKYQYQYLVAVVATNKDSSILLQLQDYQTMMFANSISVSLASIMLMTASLFLFY